MRTQSLLAGMIMIFAGLGMACNDSTILPVSPSVTQPSLPAGSNDLASGSSPSLLPQTASGAVRLRVAHLSTDAPPVDIWVNGQVVSGNVPFKAVSDYLGLEAGE